MNGIFIDFGYRNNCVVRFCAIVKLEVKFKKFDCKDLYARKRVDFKYYFLI